MVSVYDESILPSEHHGPHENVPTVSTTGIAAEIAIKKKVIIILLRILMLETAALVFLACKRV